MVHCTRLSERLEFSEESLAEILTPSITINRTTLLYCASATVDIGINKIDPGLTPNGASCGEEKMCVDQKCIPISNLRKKLPRCLQNCNGNGWCNNKGHCHCKNGFAPPDCKSEGFGGSIDSGPPTDSNALQSIRVTLLIVFLGIIPVTSFTLLLIFYFQHRFHFGWKSPLSTYTTNCLQHAASTSLSTDKPSQQQLPQKTIEIIPVGLTSTTNTDGIVRSTSITIKDVENKICNQDKLPVRKSEWRISFKNVRRLSLKINTKTDLETPKTAETVISEDDIPSFPV